MRIMSYSGSTISVSGTDVRGISKVLLDSDTVRVFEISSEDVLIIMGSFKA